MVVFQTELDRRCRWEEGLGQTARNVLTIKLKARWPVGWGQHNRGELGSDGVGEIGTKKLTLQQSSIHPSSSLVIPIASPCSDGHREEHVHFTTLPRGEDPG